MAAKDVSRRQMLFKVVVLSGASAVGKHTGGASAQAEPDFQITNVTPREVSIAEPQSVSFEVTVENRGEETGSQTIEAVIDGQIVASERIQGLGGGFQFTVDLTVPGDVLSFGQTYLITFQTRDDERSASVTVASEPEPAEPAEFTVSNLDPRTIDLEEPGPTVTVSATVTNEGEAEATKRVSLSTDGQPVSEVDLTLAGGESTMVSLNLDTSALDFSRDYEHGITTEDDGTFGLVKIAPEPTPTATETESSASAVEGGNDGDGETGLLPGVDNETDILAVVLVLLGIGGGGGLWLTQRRDDQDEDGNRMPIDRSGDGPPPRPRSGNTSETKEPRSSVSRRSDQNTSDQGNESGHLPKSDRNTSSDSGRTDTTQGRTETDGDR